MDPMFRSATSQLQTAAASLPDSSTEALSGRPESKDKELLRVSSRAALAVKQILVKTSFVRPTAFSNVTVAGVKVTDKRCFIDIVTKIKQGWAQSSLELSCEGMSCKASSTGGQECLRPTNLAYEKKDKAQHALNISGVCKDHLPGGYSWMINCRPPRKAESEQLATNFDYNKQKKLVGHRCLDCRNGTSQEDWTPEQSRIMS